MKKFKGVDIKEVWNSRLSTAVPCITRSSGTWVAEVWSKKNPDYDPSNPDTVAVPIESYDTGIKVEPGDEYDAEKVIACYEWFYSVRDKYSLDNIEELKPYVKLVEDANNALAKLGAVK